MGLLQAIVLGAVQGATEFLPVSSDGHLALAYALFGGKPNLAFEIFLHFGTLMATIVFFRHDLSRMVRALWSRAPEDAPYRRLDVLVAVGTLATVPVALALDRLIEPLSADLTAVGVFFLCTAAILALAERLARGRADGLADRMAWWNPLPIGVAQGLAVLPAISRSGSTIATGLLLGLNREESARFSFLLGVPIITLANLKETFDVVTDAGARAAFQPVPTIVGTIVAFIVGYAAVAWLLALLRRHTLYGFAIYTAVLGSVILVWENFLARILLHG